MLHSGKGRELVGLGRRCMDPSERLHILEVGVLWTLMGKSHTLVVAYLRHQDDSSDLLHLWVLSWRNAVHVASDLSAKIRDADESLEDILGEHVGVANFFEVIRVDVDMISPQMHVGGRYGSHSPVSLRGELLSFILGESCDNHLSAMDVGRLECLRLQLADGRVLVGNPLHLLLLNARWCHVHAKNDVFGLAHGQACDVDVVLLGVIGQNEVLQLDFDMHPLLVGQCWPDMVRLRDHALVWRQDDLGSLWMQMEGSQDQDEPTEAGEALDALLPVIVEIEQKHLWLCRFQDAITKFLDLQASLERKLQLAALDHNIWEVEQMDLQGIQHTLSRDDDLLWLFFDR